MSISTSAILVTIPAGLRDPLMVAFGEIVKNFREQRWEPAELNGGKLCETIYSILEGHVSGKFPLKPSKPKNMVDACKALEQADQTKFSRSVRIQIPRMLVALYEIRNNRGVGHVGSDVNPNHMDSVIVMSMSKWCLAELVRIFHNVDTAAATVVVESLIQKTTPIVWEVAGNKRILDAKLGMKDQALLLLYNAIGPVKETDLFKWTEHSNTGVFRRDILQKCHKQRLIEYDRLAGLAHISPTGVRYVEDNLPLELSS